MTHTSRRPEAHAALLLSEWERGIVVTSDIDPSAFMYLWFWEWNMFGAIAAGQHTHGTFENSVRVANEGQSAVITTEHGISLSLQLGSHGVDMELAVTNSSNRDWSELASIIPCFNPGPPDSPTQRFRTKKTSFIGSEGFNLLASREIHFNEALRAKVVDGRDAAGKFPWSEKWPISPTDATAGLLVRESSDARWVTGIAWDRFLSTQGNNPWECMHVAIRVGPLAPGETRDVHGNIYLLEGTKEDLLQAHGTPDEENDVRAGHIPASGLKRQDPSGTDGPRRQR